MSRRPASARAQRCRTTQVSKELQNRGAWYFPSVVRVSHNFQQLMDLAVPSTAHNAPSLRSPPPPHAAKKPGTDYSSRLRSTTRTARHGYRVATRSRLRTAHRASPTPPAESGKHL